jgi:hypothetical protein
MGFFSNLGAGLANKLELKTLDVESDMFLASVAKFDPLLVDNGTRKKVTALIESECLNSIDGGFYTVPEAALRKLNIYRQVFERQPDVLERIRLASGRVLDKFPGEIRGSISLDSQT